jgi:hypothetical protein
MTGVGPLRRQLAGLREAVAAVEEMILQQRQRIVELGAVGSETTHAKLVLDGLVDAVQRMKLRKQDIEHRIRMRDPEGINDRSESIPRAAILINGECHELLTQRMDQAMRPRRSKDNR